MVRIVTVLALAWLLAAPTFACEEIAVLYRNAKYVLLDGDTLELVDVGNLWWQGVWVIDHVWPGSTAEHFAITSDRLSTHLARSNDGVRKEALVAFENLREQADGSPMAITHDYDIYRFRHARWVNGIDQFVVWQQETSVLSALDRVFGEVGRWSLPSHDIGETFACHIGGVLVIGGHRHRTLLQDTNTLVEALAFPEDTQDCTMRGPFQGCLGGFECRRNDLWVTGVVDVKTNEVAFAFEHKGRFTIPKDPLHARQFARFENRLLFASATRLLQQEVLYTPDTPGQNSYRFRPLPRLRVLDTQSGRVVAENVRAPVGQVSRLLCLDSQERVVVSEEGRVQLIDLATLEPIATVAIPDGRHYVF